MSALRQSVPPFVRDAVVATLAFALVLAPVVYYLEPEFLRYPGFLLYFPFMFVYILLGGETESPFGPSNLQVGLYVLVLGVATAGVAHFLRTRYDVSGAMTLRFLLAAAIAVCGTLGALFGLLGATGFVAMGLPIAAALFVLGVGAIGVALLLAGRGS